MIKGSVDALARPQTPNDGGAPLPGILVGQELAKKLKVKLGDHILRTTSSNVAIDAGHYDLFRSRDGQIATFPARYSFVLVKHGAAWLIAHHHSSMQPQPMT